MPLLHRIYGTNVQRAIQRFNDEPCGANNFHDHTIRARTLGVVDLLFEAGDANSYGMDQVLLKLLQTVLCGHVQY